MFSSQTTCFLAALAALLSTQCWAYGYKSINEICVKDPGTPTNPRNCDQAQYLICGKNSLCTCASNLHWQDDQEKCTFGVKAYCTETNVNMWSSGDGNNQQTNLHSPGCPTNSECDYRGTGRCECDEGFEPNEDLTECSGSLSSLATLFPLLLCLGFLWAKNLLL